MSNGPDALAKLIASIPQGPEWTGGKPINNWEAAREAVQFADPATAMAALEHLLALRLHDLQATTPQVAFRNLRVGDLVEMYGARRRITELLPGHVRADGNPELFAMAPDAHLPLLERRADGS